uniref:Secreted protein n=1 Tax=Chlamydomonas euryale TaxID=1486919 RepID=A0A7R9YTU9_9CHLO
MAQLPLLQPATAVAAAACCLLLPLGLVPQAQALCNSSAASCQRCAGVGPVEATKAHTRRCARATSLQPGKVRVHNTTGGPHNLQQWSHASTVQSFPIQCK